LVLADCKPFGQRLRSFAPPEGLKLSRTLSSA